MDATHNRLVAISKERINKTSHLSTPWLIFFLYTGGKYKLPREFLLHLMHLDLDQLLIIFISTTLVQDLSQQSEIFLDVQRINKHPM